MSDFLSKLIMQSREPAAIITPQQKPPDQTVFSPQTVEPPKTRRARIEVTPTIIAQPRIAAYAEPNASPIQQAAAVSESQSVINVTNGRVEVRATTSQSRIRRSSRAQSFVMSLDEYLRQRKEGGR